MNEDERAAFWETEKSRDGDVGEATVCS